MNSSYKISMKTPIGLKRGTLVLSWENGLLNGYISAMGYKSPFTDGKTDGNTFEFSGTLNAGFSKFKYSAKGTMTGDSLSAIAATKYGNLRIEGKKL